jgi:PTH1 family peptidyl-tRNA hydrolase
MKLIVGLGNPGDKYAGTRHNAGFWLIERLAAQSGTVLRKDGKFQALVGRHDASGAWLVMPQSFMNSSGRPVQMMASFFKIQPAEVLIVHDELDLAPGIARLKQGGGVAGHNGLKDVSARLGSHDYWRLRLGIGRPAEKGAAIDYVLRRPAQDEREAIDEAIARALEVLPLVLAADTQGAMLKLHTGEQERKPQQPAEAERAARAPRPEAPPPSARVEPVVEQAGTPATAPAVPQPEPVGKPSGIERPGDTVDAGRIGPETDARAPEASAALEKAAAPEEAGKAGRAGKAQKAGKTEKTGKAEKSGRGGGLNSLLKKFLPGSGDTRRK